MPVNKNASFRYRVINQCLRNTGRKWTMEDIVETVSDEIFIQLGIEKGISLRTIQYDINIMRSDPPRGFAAPIVCENGYYFYDDPDYSIDKTPLNETDIENLQDAANILKQFSHLPLYAEMQGLMGKLEENILQNKDSSIISFEYNPDYKNIDIIGSLYKLLKSQVMATFQYKSFKNNAFQTLTISPLLLKEYRNRWFLFGWNEEFNNFSNLAVDRIVSFQETQHGAKCAVSKDYLT